MVDNILKWLLETTFLRDIGTELMAVLEGTTLNIDSFSSTLSNAITPIAISIITLLWCIEMFETFTRVNYGTEQVLWQQFIMLGVKLLFAKALITYSPIIIKSIIEIGNSLIANLGELTGSIAGGDIDELMNEVADAGMMERLSLIAMLLPLGLFGLVSAVAVRLAIYSRAIKLILLQVFSPIPMATLPFESHSAMGKRFLQSLIGAVLQGAMIVVILLLGKQISKVGMINVSEDVSIIGELVKALILNIILAFTLFKSEAWAKEVAGLG